MKPASALALVAVGGFFFVLARRRPTDENGGNERVDVNEVDCVSKTPNGLCVHYVGFPTVVASAPVDPTAGEMNQRRFYMLGTLDADGDFIPERGNTNRTTGFYDLEKAVKVAKDRNAEEENRPTLPENQPRPKPNPYDIVNPPMGFGNQPTPSYGW
jgi:hypothetical protein